MKLQDCKLTPFTKLILVLVFSFLAVGCSKVKLNRVTEAQTFSSQGKFCVTVEGFTRYNKILFVIDKSGSNNDNDPNDVRRGDNIQRFLDLYRNDAYYKWGFISFNADVSKSYITDPVTGSPIFGTAAQMQDGINTYRTEGDNNNTPYLTALNLARLTIQEDIVNNPDEDSVYNVFFMSDGRPTDTSNGGAGYVTNSPNDPYIRAVRDVVSLAANKIFISTAFYTPGAPDTVQEALGLRYMAEAGGGTFTNMENSDTLDFDAIKVGVRRKPMIIKRMAIVNLNSGFCLDGTIDVDSDADGLCDKDEEWINAEYAEVLNGKKLSPTNRNSVNPDYSDKFVYKFELLPTGDDLGNCTLDRDDVDHDLVTPCEEILLSDNNANGPTPQWTEEMKNLAGGTADQKNPDSDGDGFLDGLEFFQFGVRAAAVNYMNIFDRFSGGITGETLMIEHRHPRAPERFDHHSYDASLIYAGVNSEGDNCYNFDQNQLALYPTRGLSALNAGSKPGLAHESGENVILMYYIAVPEDDPNSRGYYFYSYQKLNHGRGASAIQDLDYDKYTSYRVPALVGQ